MSCCASPDVDTFLFLWKHSALSFGHWNTSLICTAALGRDEKMCSTTIDRVSNWGCSESLLRSIQRQIKIESLRSFGEFLLLQLQTWSHVSTLTDQGSFWGVFETQSAPTNISLGWEMSLFGRWLEVPAGEAALLLKLHPLAHLVSLDQAAKLWSVLVVGCH